jgi:hypothetical protein
MMSSLPFNVKKYGRNNGDLCKITLELSPRIFEEVSKHLKAPPILFEYCQKFHGDPSHLPPFPMADSGSESM